MDAHVTKPFTFNLIASTILGHDNTQDAYQRTATSRDHVHANASGAQRLPPLIEVGTNKPKLETQHNLETQPNSITPDTKPVTHETQSDLSALGAMPYDQEAAVALLGSVSIFDKTLTRLIESETDTISDMRKALDDENVTEARRHAHSLVGLSAYVGAQQLGELASAMEKANTPSADQIALIENEFCRIRQWRHTEKVTKSTKKQPSRAPRISRNPSSERSIGRSGTLGYW